MKSKVSKAQKEVWEWKEKLYEEIKNIPEGKRLEYISSKTKKTIDRIKSARKKAS